MKTQQKAQKPVVPVIVGPTASGKTNLAIQIAKRLDGEIVSADSMQIYRRMNVGTAKPTESEKQGIPHHLMDFVEPDQAFSVADYKDRAVAAIRDITARGKTAIVAGGTGLYINALTQKWGFPGIKTDPKIREKLNDAYKTETPEAVYRRLKQIDPEAAAKIHPHNRKRVIRALEIYETTGKTKTYWESQVRKIDLPFDYLLLGIQMPRDVLYQRIDQRVDVMIEDGLVEEVRALLNDGYDPSLVSMQALGYKEIVPYLKGRSSLEEQVRILKRDTRHFAKRQLTWFRKNQDIHWFSAEKNKDSEQLANQMIQCIEQYKGEHNIER